MNTFQYSLSPFKPSYMEPPLVHMHRCLYPSVPELCYKPVIKSFPREVPLHQFHRCIYLSREIFGQPFTFFFVLSFSSDLVVFSINVIWWNRFKIHTSKLTSKRILIDSQTIKVKIIRHNVTSIPIGMHIKGQFSIFF